MQSNDSCLNIAKPYTVEEFESESAFRPYDKFRMRATAYALARAEARLRKYERVELALRGILDIGKRDTSNPKYDGYFEEANNSLSELNKP